MIFRIFFLIVLLGMAVMIFRHRPSFVLLRKQWFWFAPMLISLLLFAALALWHTLDAAGCDVKNPGPCFGISLALSISTLLSVGMTPLGMFFVYRSMRAQP